VGLRDDPGAAAGQFIFGALVDVDVEALLAQLQGGEQAAHRAADHDGSLSLGSFSRPARHSPGHSCHPKNLLYCAANRWRNAMALSTLDKKAAAEERSAWPAEIKAEFERENRQHNGCVGTELLSETDKVRVWIIRLQPGERVGFHRHVLNYFWTSVNGGRGRQHLMDGTTVEHTYFPGETRHETYGPGQYKVHDLENLGDKEMIFNTIEFLDSANKPLPVPDHVRLSHT
jgi:hypothetical protein